MRTVLFFSKCGKCEIQHSATVCLGTMWVLWVSSVVTTKEFVNCSKPSTTNQHCNKNVNTCAFRWLWIWFLTWYCTYHSLTILYIKDHHYWNHFDLRSNLRWETLFRGVFQAMMWKDVQNTIHTRSNLQCSVLLKNTLCWWLNHWPCNWWTTLPPEP